MRRSVCPFVWLWVIRSVRFKCVCVFFWAEVVLLNGLRYSPLPRWRAVCWQHTSPPVLSEISCMHLGSSVTTRLYFQQQAKNFSPGCKLAGWDTRFSYPERLFCVLWKPFENFPFFTLSLWRVSETVRTFENVIPPLLYTHSRHQLRFIGAPMRCEEGPVCSFTGCLLQKGG